MYVILKNDKTILSHGMSKHTWKYLDECREAAMTEAEAATTKDIISVCELNPLYTYNLELACKEQVVTEEPSEEPSDEQPTEPDNGEEQPSESDTDEQPSEDEQPEQ